jgi:DNA-binding response OmpR family regulator
MQPRLLIVEDEVAILTALKHFFTHQGFEVDAVRRLGASNTHE